jgi:streptomycin 6-kinase
MIIPQALATNCRNDPARRQWLSHLPDALDHLTHRWSLKLGTPFDGEEVSCSWVATVTFADGATAVLKVGMPHMEGEHEIEGLRFWDGDPTVRLLHGDDDLGDDLGAMLLERCDPGTALRAVPEPQQDVVIAGLLRRMWRTPTPGHPFRPLSALLSHWSDETRAQSQHWPDPGLVSEGLQLFEELPQTAPANVLLATDLHAGNVLSAQREPWLAIDPKPFIGDPAYDATQHLLNCYSRMGSDADETISRFADLLGVDRERLRLWTFAREAADPRGDWKNSRWFDLARALARKRRP